MGYCLYEEHEPRIWHIPKPVYKELCSRTFGDNIDMIAGASSSGGNFRRLAAAVLECAEQGDTEIAVVPAENVEE